MEEVKMELIDKEKLLEAIDDCDYCDHCRLSGCLCVCDNYTNEEAIVNLIKVTPAVDAVEVVRCKDCLHYRPMVAFDGECMCDVFQWKSEPMDYCSFAERKEVQDERNK